uniref:FkbM family methyltransferase n=1 Tax=Trichocoleus desertorum TaxID=1481672 RepID=UPI0025B4D0B7|nr:FkbM family methyltransferase [Trichocoleus desertorum]
MPTAEELNQIVNQIAESERRKTLWLRNMEIETILDVGANTGQFAKFMHELFPRATLYSFEPLQDCYEELLDQFKDVPEFQAFNVALGDETGTVEMHRSEYSPSSSLLCMNELHKTSFPYSKQESLQKVDIVCLDDMANRLKLRKPMLVKLDVQGYEDKVISGGKNVINQADIVITELSVEQLYDGQPLFDDIYKTMASMGFQYRGNYDQLCSPDDGRVLQVDGIFSRA